MPEFVTLQLWEALLCGWGASHPAYHASTPHMQKGDDTGPTTPTKTQTKTTKIEGLRYWGDEVSNVHTTILSYFSVYRHAR